MCRRAVGLLTGPEQKGIKIVIILIHEYHAKFFLHFMKRMRFYMWFDYIFQLHQKMYKSDALGIVIVTVLLGVA
jgi:hypothetical protein